MHEHRKRALLHGLAEYRTALVSAAGAAARVGNVDASVKESASLLEQHVGVAESIRVALEAGDPDEFERLVRSEIRAYGWSYLPGEAGQKVETAWNRFCRSTGIEV